jgi:hypothetical protein
VELLLLVLLLLAVASVVVVLVLLLLPVVDETLVVAFVPFCTAVLALDAPAGMLPAPPASAKPAV